MTSSGFGLYLKILVCDSSSLFNPDPKKFKYKYSILETKDTYLIYKPKYQEFKPFANLNQFDLNKDENLIFNIKIKPKSIIIRNKLDDFVLINLNKYYYYLNDSNNFNNLNNRLWKSILKYDDDKKIINDKNISNYIFDLNENDIIRLGNIKIILREFHLSGNDIKNYASNKIKDIFTLKLKNEKDKICSICKKGFEDNNNPIVQFCNCKEDKKYIHYLCKKKEIENKDDDDNSLKGNKNNGYINFFLNTQCLDCGSFFPLSFYIEETDENNKKIYNHYELIDIPRNKDEDYLLFETLEFKNRANHYVKYFFYVKLEKKEQTNIMIGSKETIDDNNKYNFDIIIKMEEANTISRNHALIEYNKQTQKLKLKNISELQNTLVLKNFRYEFELEPNNHDNLY